MSDDKKPVDRAVELFLYAPVGLAVEARTLLPRLIERGREQVDGQVTMARMVGQFAVRQGRSQATSRVSSATETARGTLGELGLVPSARAGSARGDSSRVGGDGEVPPSTVAAPGAPEHRPAHEPSPLGETRASATEHSDAVTSENTTSDTPASDAVASGPSAAVGAPDVELVGIPDYDSLAASQVIPRLAGLSEEELESVKAYETAKRGRKTILNKINQLQR